MATSLVILHWVVTTQPPRVGMWTARNTSGCTVHPSHNNVGTKRRRVSSDSARVEERSEATKRQNSVLQVGGSNASYKVLIIIYYY